MRNEKILKCALNAVEALVAFGVAAWTLFASITVLVFVAICWIISAFHAGLVFVCEKISNAFPRLHIVPKAMAYIIWGVIVTLLTIAVVRPLMTDSPHEANGSAVVSEEDEAEIVSEIEEAVKGNINILKGVDVSHYQTVSKWEAADPDFVIVKTGEGSNCDDGSAEAHLNRAKELNKLIGTYHLVRPDLHPSDDSAKQEAQYYFSRLTELGWNHDWVLACDLEPDFMLATQTETARYCKTFLDEVCRLTGVRPLLYINQGCVEDSAWKDVAKHYGLWVTGYPQTENTERWDNVKDDRIAYAYTKGVWSEVAIWQYSTLDGLDRNLGYMTEEAWGKFANPQ